MIHQIYYKPEQLSRIACEPHFNEKVSVYFENDVILELIERPSELYFGVLPWNVDQKISRMRKFRTPFRDLNYSLDYARAMMQINQDVIFLMKHESHDPILEARKIHPKFADLWEWLFFQLGHPDKIGKEWKDVIYCNFFIAKHHIYERYVSELLAPAMFQMSMMKGFDEDAKYPKKITPEIAEQTGFPHYTYHPFICERLFSYWYNFMR